MHLIVGAGAVGTVLAHYLLAAGEAVQFLVREGREDHYGGRESLRFEQASDGLVLEQTAPKVTSAPDWAAVDHIYLCCKHQHLDAVLAGLRGQLHSDCVLYPCLNGVSHKPVIQAAFPKHKICSLAIMYNSQLPEPMHVVLTTKPLIYLTQPAPQLSAALKRGGMIVQQGNDGSSWGKLLLNLNNPIGALTHSTFKDLLLDANLRQIALACLDEAVATLEAAGIHYDVPLPIPIQIQRWTMRHTPKLSWWFAKRRTGIGDQSYPSMVSDVLAERRTEIREINGAIVTVGKEHGLATPINSGIVDLVIANEEKPAVFLTPAELAQKLGLRQYRL